MDASTILWLFHSFLLEFMLFLREDLVQFLFSPQASSLLKLSLITGSQVIKLLNKILQYKGQTNKELSEQDPAAERNPERVGFFW